MKPSQLKFLVICAVVVPCCADCCLGQAQPMESDFRTRCRSLLKIQSHIHREIVKLHAASEKSRGKITGKLQQQTARKLAAEQMSLAGEVDKILSKLKADGAAVAISEVFEQLRDDMKKVARRLRNLDAGKMTIFVEDDIFATLQEILHGLRK